MSGSLDQAWEEVSPDPDPAVDLGYEIRSLSVIPIEDGGEKYIVLPSEEEYLLDDEFIIAEPDSFCRLEECR